MKSPYLRQRREPRRNFKLLERRRRLGMKLLSAGVPQAEVARRCLVSETTVFRWKEARAKKGPSAWKRGRLGRPPGRTGKTRRRVAVHARGSRFRLGLEPSLG